MLKSPVLLLSLLVVLSGCANMSRTDQRMVSGAAIGGPIGAGVDAGIDRYDAR